MIEKNSIKKLMIIVIVVASFSSVSAIDSFTNKYKESLNEYMMQNAPAMQKLGQYLSMFGSLPCVSLPNLFKRIFFYLPSSYRKLQISNNSTIKGNEFKYKKPNQWYMK